jgi:hypothetical protein
MAKPKGKTPEHLHFTRVDIVTGAILADGTGTRCRVDRVEQDTVYMTVLDEKLIDGKGVVEMPILSLVSAQWQMLKKAKAA